ncbi:MAG TPA: UpxY family transcription antiterminator [Bacteroidaceae bacterium]|nr:UpxY family transcription antiterminator [Bacteroidaceae bacterium]
MNPVLKWFALRTNYCRDLKVAALLNEKGIRYYIPMKHKQVTKAGIVKRIQVPVIRNLIFVYSQYSTLNNLKKELESSMPIRIIMNKSTGKPAVICDKEMNDFILISGTDCDDLIYMDTSEANLKVGDKVEVIEGIFKGAEGKLVRIKGHKRVLVSIEGVVAVATAFIPAMFLKKIET